MWEEAEEETYAKELRNREERTAVLESARISRWIVPFAGGPSLSLSLLLSPAFFFLSFSVDNSLRFRVVMHARRIDSQPQEYADAMISSEIRIEREKDGETVY